MWWIITLVYFLVGFSVWTVFVGLDVYDHRKCGKLYYDKEVSNLISLFFFSLFLWPIFALILICVGAVKGIHYILNWLVKTQFKIKIR